MAQFMDRLWNGMVSATTKGLMIDKEPGESSYAYSAKKLTEITSLIASKSKDVSLESLREMILSSCDEFNHGHFFMLVQFGILVYYPSVALSIVYQSYEQEVDEQQFMSDTFDDTMQQEPQPQPQSQSQSMSIEQIIRALQRMISDMMQQKQPFIQPIDQFMTEQQAITTTRRAIKMMPKKEEKGDDDERCIVRLQGRPGGQKKVIWTTVFIQI